MRAIALAGAFTTGRFLPRSRTVYSRKRSGIEPTPSRPGPVCALSTGPISLTITGGRPKISRQRSSSRCALVGRVDVLHRPGVGARLVALAGVVHHPLEHPGARAHALDRRHLALHGEDRLDLQRRADPGARRADPPAALEELERVDAEPQLQLAARLAHPLFHLVEAGTARRRARGRDRQEAEPAGDRGRVHHPDPLAALAVALERLGGLTRGLRRAAQPTRDVDRDHVLAPSASSGS